MGQCSRLLPRPRLVLASMGGRGGQTTIYRASGVNQRRLHGDHAHSFRNGFRGHGQNGLGIAPQSGRLALAAPCSTIFIAGPAEFGFQRRLRGMHCRTLGLGRGQDAFRLNGKVRSVFKRSPPLVSRYEVDGRGERRIHNDAATGALIGEEACPAP